MIVLFADQFFSFIIWFNYASWSSFHEAKSVDLLVKNGLTPQQQVVFECSREMHQKSQRLKVCLRKWHLHHVLRKMRAPFVMKIKMEKKKLPVYLVDIIFTRSAWKSGWSRATSGAHCAMMSSRRLSTDDSAWAWPLEDQGGCFSPLTNFHILFHFGNS